MTRRRNEAKVKLPETVDYPYLRAWDEMMHSNRQWTEMRLAEARGEAAPDDAVFKRLDGSWARMKEVRVPDTKATIDTLVVAKARWDL